MTSATTRDTGLSRRQKLAAALLSLLWLVPLLPIGLARATVQARLSPRLYFFHDIGCLFPRRTPTWARYYVEGRLAGSSEWIENEHRRYFQIEPFGYRTRLDFAMHVKQADDVPADVCRFLRLQHNSEPANRNRQVARLRILEYTFPASRYFPAPWPPLSAVPRHQLHELYVEPDSVLD